ncbi:MAG: carbohydrate kinase [Bacteroidales bacterium]|nr:carbohydrate kinase [Bacteroidales bacterium]
MENHFRRIFTIGETVLDILFKNDVAIRSIVGGSMLNVAVSLARMGCNTHLISEISNDLCGNLILRFLKNNHIETNSLFISEDGQTAISMALLDKNNDAQYEFYRAFPEKRLSISIPTFTDTDIVAFGSFFAINEAVRKPLLSIVSAAKDAEAIIFYDPNIRQNHCPLSGSALRLIEENIALSDVVRGSNEDFLNIFNTNDLSEVYKSISLNGCRHLLMTCGKEGVWYQNENLQLHLPSKPIQPVSTIGAGDTFNAGFLYGLVQNNIFKNNFTYELQQHISSIIQNSIELSSEVCMSEENYVAVNCNIQ